MSRSDGLIPTQVVNKNGVLTTVYKKGENPNSTLAAIPVPALLAPERSKQEVIGSLTERLHNVNQWIEDQELNDVDVRLRSWDLDALERLEKASAHHDKAGEIILHLLVVDDNDAIVNMAAHFIPDLPEKAWTGSATLIRGLSHYQGLDQYYDFTRAEDSVQRQCLSLIKVASALEHYSGRTYVDDPDNFPVVYRHNQNKNYRYIREEALVELVLERPEDADRITALIQEHGSIETNALRGLLDGTDPAFASGAL